MSGFCNIPAEDTALLRRKLSEDEVSTTAILDMSTIIIDKAMHRYVSQRESMASLRGANNSAPDKWRAAAADNTWYGALRAESASTVRPFPYASLFLYPLPDELSAFPRAAPAALFSSSSSSSSSFYSSPFSSAEVFRPMALVRGGAAAVVAVLQGECGLAIANGDDAFVFSPDATSCAIVACRVGLHPALRRDKATAVKKTSGTKEKKREGKEREEGKEKEKEEEEEKEKGDGDGANVDDDNSDDDNNDNDNNSSGSARARVLCALLQKCSVIFTAAMAHIDSADGAECALHDALWEGAVPAWIKAAHIATNCPPHELFAYLHEALQEEKKKDKEDKDKAEGGGTIFMVEWFMVGGIRVRDKSEPHMCAILRAFFLPRAAARPLLSSSLSLSALCALSPGAPDVPLSFSHRLREDGVCIWSHNTVLRHWAHGERGALFACAASFGLFISVASGACGPAAAKPKARRFPLAELRSLARLSSSSSSSLSLSFLFPLRREGIVRVSRAAAATKRAAERFGLRACGKETTTNLSLDIYVEQFLQRLRRLHEGTKDKEKKEEEKGKEEEKEEEKEVLQLPVLLRCCAWYKVHIGSLDDVPDFALLKFSTTPHCEPSDFVELMRTFLKLRSEFSSEDIFPPHTFGIFA